MHGPLPAPTLLPMRFSLRRPAGQSAKGPESHPIPNGATRAWADRWWWAGWASIARCSRGPHATAPRAAPLGGQRQQAASRQPPLLPPLPGWHSRRPLRPVPAGMPSPPPEPAAPGGMSWAARVASASSKPASAPPNGAAAADGTDKATSLAPAAPPAPPAVSSGVAGVKLPPGVEGALLGWLAWKLQVCRAVTAKQGAWSVCFPS